ncbi:MAG: hypothetical protein FJZ01_14355 [Candidatus Sericytochromatia bacterium]|nr:hypothetical protein [Candidatus Tanganyikabacteria bacterium]
MGLGSISGALTRVADVAADVAAGAIAEAVVAVHGGVPRKYMERVERDARQTKVRELPPVGPLARILAEFAASTPDVDIRRLRFA